MLVSPNQLPSGEITVPAEVVTTSVGALAVEEYTSPGAIAEISTEEATLGSFQGHSQDETGWKTSE
ncbi:MAG TPA: hypothetical protein VLA92_03175 [Candidatus Saccharimonadales bacterium]|nr:hypothetical protein [Candidatus Saccharimonadales bacterium]